jgi:hypothetical protein
LPVLCDRQGERDAEMKAKYEEIMQFAYITHKDGNGVTCRLCGLHYETLVGWQVWRLRLHTKDAECALQEIRRREGQRELRQEEPFSCANLPLSWWRQEYTRTTIKFWFGKHMGKDLTQVPIGYLRWLLREDPEVRNGNDLLRVSEYPGFLDAVRKEIAAR